MADNIAPLKSELMAALALLAPQIRGLHDLTVVSISPDLAAQVGAQIASRERRRDLCQAVITALENLSSDGYPTLPQDMVQPSLFSELQEEVADLQAAAGVFQADNAAHLQMTFGQPVSKE